MTSQADGWWNNLSDKEKQDTYAAMMLKKEAGDKDEFLVSLEPVLENLRKRQKVDTVVASLDVMTAYRQIGSVYFKEVAELKKRAMAILEIDIADRMEEG